MSYSIEIKPFCEDSIKKHCKKNHSLECALTNKVKEILMNPNHYKPLKYAFAGTRRVHIMKSYVLIFEVDENRKIVTLLFFGHHDDAYEREIT